MGGIELRPWEKGFTLPEHFNMVSLLPPGYRAKIVDPDGQEIPPGAELRKGAARAVQIPALDSVRERAAENSEWRCYVKKLEEEDRR